jgi:hypothetical protein
MTKKSKIQSINENRNLKKHLRGFYVLAGGYGATGACHGVIGV